MITVADLKLALRLPAGSVEDAYLAALEAAAVAHVQQVTGESYAAATGAVTYAVGTGAPQLWLPAVFTATPAVLEHAELGDVGAAVTDFVVRTGYLLRTGGNVWTWGYEYQVTGNTGYTAGTEPADIRQAVIQLVSHWYEFRTPVVAGMSVADVPLSVNALLEPHRRFPVA